MLFCTFLKINPESQNIADPADLNPDPKLCILVTDTVFMFMLTTVFTPSIIYDFTKVFSKITSYFRKR